MFLAENELASHLPDSPRPVAPNEQDEYFHLRNRAESAVEDPSHVDRNGVFVYGWISIEATEGPRTARERRHRRTLVCPAVSRRTTMPGDAVPLPKETT